MTRPVIEPRSPRPLVNTLPTRPISRFSCSQLKRMQNMEKRILEVKHTRNISYLEAKKLVKNSVITTYANVAKLTNNSTQNQRIIHYKMINLIKELKTLIELLRESLTLDLVQPHAKPDPMKNLYLQTNKAKDPKKQSIPTLTLIVIVGMLIKLDYNKSPPLTPK